MGNASVNAASRKLLDEFIAKQDLDKNVPLALSEADVIELALRLLTIADGSPLTMPLEPIYNLAVAQFRLTRK